MTLLSGAAWAVTDDDGTGQSGTIANAAWVDAIEASINALIHSAANPTVTPEDIIDEVVAARNGAASLLLAIQAADSTSYLTGASDLGANWVISQRHLRWKHANVAHGMTSQFPTDVWGVVQEFNAGFGGASMIGLSEGDGIGLVLSGFNGSAAPTVAAVELRGAKKSGTTVTDLAATEILFRIRNNSTLLATMYGSGNLALANGLAVGFFATADADAIHVGDATFKMDNPGGAPSISFDSNDRLRYDRTLNAFFFDIGGTTVLRFDAVGLALKSGAIVPSAPAIALTGNVQHISGTTNITSISSPTSAGFIATLIFDGVLTFTDGGNLVLAGNFVTTAGDSITLIYDGTVWVELCRSVN